MIDVRVLRPFNNGDPRNLTRPGEVIPVDDVRADELEMNGLAEKVGGEKAAPVPENKAAPVAVNKAITSDSIRPARVPARAVKDR